MGKKGFALVLLSLSGCVSSAAPAAAPGFRVTRLRCEYREDPLNVETPRPRLSWIMESDRNGQRQTAYRIRAFTDATNLWDSGKVESDQSVHVTYGGRPLRFGETVAWQVEVWNQDGVKAVSAPARWEAGPLTPEDWSAKWIGLTPQERKDPEAVTGTKWIEFPSAGKGQHYFRRSFEIPEGARVKRAELRVAADRECGAYLNTKGIGRIRSRDRFEAFDVRADLLSGRNVIALWAKNPDGPPRVAAQLRIEFEDGQTLRLSTDKTWKALDRGISKWWRRTFDDKDWGTAQEGEPIENANAYILDTPAAHLRKTFRLPKSFHRARVYATALGLYELHINGRRVSPDRFAPGWTDYKKRVLYQAYDVTSLLKEGDNVIGAILGDGWYGGKAGGWLRKHDLWGPYPPKLLLRLDVETAEGKISVVSDGSWKGSSGPILLSDIMDGEIYDARLEMPGWDAPGFSDAAWRAVEVFEEKRNVTADPGPPIRVTQELRARSVTERAPGVFVFDLGQVMVGWTRLKVRGAAGTEVSLRHAEMLNPNGTFFDNVAAARVTDRYILKGGNEEVFEPRFTYCSFRYVEVTGYPGKPALDAVTGCVAHSDTPPAGKFECSNPLINKLHENILWSQRGNFFSVPTDCPQRTERLGWMGDAQIFCRTAAFNADIASFFTKWMWDVIDAQSPEGAFTEVVPNINFKEGAPAWGDAGIIVPWTIYLCYGDTRILEEHYVAMTKWIEFVRKNNPDLLWKNHRGGDYGDHVAFAPTDKEALATAYFAHSTDLMSRIAKVLKKKEDAKKYEALFEAIRGAFCLAYVENDGRLKSDTQTIYALALRFHLVPNELEEGIVRYFVEDIEKRGNQLTTGYAGVSHLLPALTQIYRTDVAYRMLLQESCPSWLHMVKSGATTTWERWNGWTADQGFVECSYNHFAFGSVGEWMYSTIAGIDLDPQDPAYKTVFLHAEPGPGITWARAEYDSMYGKIASEWKVEGKTLKWKVTLPPNTRGSLCPPGISTRFRKDIESGKHEFSFKLE